MQWQDLAAGRPTEVDHLNGIIQRLGRYASVNSLSMFHAWLTSSCRKKGIPTPIHDAVVASIREAEMQKRSPRLSPQELHDRILSKPFHRTLRARLVPYVALLLPVAVLFLFFIILWHHY